MTYRYRAYGLSFDSALELPDFAPDSGDGPADVTISLGHVDDALAGATERFGVWQAAPQAFHLDIPEAGRYLIRDGQTILIQPYDHAGGVDVRAFLRSSAMAAVLQQRGILTIHASVVADKAGAVFFCGPSGAGKSTTAAGLHQRGWQVVTDDILAIRATPDGPRAIPGPAAVWLWPDAGENLGVADGERGESRPGTGKFHLPIRHADRDLLPIRAGFHLKPGGGSEVTSDRISPRESFEILWNYTFRRRFAIGMGLRAQVFAQVSELARTAPLWRIERPVDRFVLDEVLDRVAGHLDGPDTQG